MSISRANSHAFLSWPSWKLTLTTSDPSLPSATQGRAEAAYTNSPFAVPKGRHSPLRTWSEGRQEVISRVSPSRSAHATEQHASPLLPLWRILYSPRSPAQRKLSRDPLLGPGRAFCSVGPPHPALQLDTQAPHGGEPSAFNRALPPAYRTPLCETYGGPAGTHAPLRSIDYRIRAAR